MENAAQDRAEKRQAFIYAKVRSGHMEQGELIRMYVGELSRERHYTDAEISQETALLRSDIDYLVETGRIKRVPENRRILRTYDDDTAPLPERLAG